jgi:hypothetical protein
MKGANYSAVFGFQLTMQNTIRSISSCAVIEAARPGVKSTQAVYNLRLLVTLAASFLCNAKSIGARS